MVDDSVLLSRAARDLSPLEQAAILRVVGEADGALHGAVVDVDLGAASSVSVKVHARSDLAHFPNVVLEVVPGSMARSQKGLAGLVGMSHAWTVLRQAAERASTSHAPVLLSGEAGTGKLAVARALHAESGHPDVTVLDVASVVPEGEQRWLHRLREALSDRPVIVAHLHLCRGTLAAAVATEIGAASPLGRLAATVTTPHPRDPEVASLLHRFPVRLQVPPLRDRRDDIEGLVSCFVRRHAPGDQVRFHPSALRALGSVEFTGNVRELERLVAGLVATRRGDILPRDLPPLTQSAPVHLTAIERAERDVIVKVLQEVKGIKAVAAARLGISRPTLYRKLATYDIEREGSRESIRTFGSDGPPMGNGGQRVAPKVQSRRSQ